MRMIDADALIKYCDDNWIPLNVDAVNAQPTIEECKTGRWSEAERKKSEVFYCSVCGGRAYHPWIGSRKSDEKNVCRYRFCPNCGADMRGDK